jgi:pimeloyl-ACP methyl ester carboxylesterase
MTTWILLRGWSREARHWLEFPRLLGQALGGANIVAPDLPGAGTRHRERSPVRVKTIMERVREEILPAARGPYGFVGMSLGSMVCIEWMARHSDEVAAAALIGTSGRPVSPFYRRLMPSSYGAIARVLLETNLEQREARILELTSTSAARRDDLAARFAAYAAEQPMTRHNAGHQLLAAATWRIPDEVPGAPLIFLAGAADRLVDSRCSQALAERWDAPFELHPGAGHDVALDDPAWVAAAIARRFRPT